MTLLNGAAVLIVLFGLGWAEYAALGALVDGNASSGNVRRCIAVWESDLPRSCCSLSAGATRRRHQAEASLMTPENADYGSRQ